MRRIYYFLGTLSLLVAILLFTRIFEPALFAWVQERIGRMPTERTGIILRQIGFAALGLAVLFFLYARWIFPKRIVIIERIRLLAGRGDVWLEQRLNPYIDFSTDSPLDNARKRLNVWDAVFIVAALIFSCFYFLERIQGTYPLVVLGSDAGNIASMAAAFDHPAWFTRDAFLGDFANLRPYMQLHVLLVRWLENLFGDYSIAITSLLVPTIFLYLVSLFVMGRTIFHTRFWAFIFVLYNIVPLYLLFETWGIVRDPVPRTLIQALVPLLLSLLWIWRNQPKWWPIIAILTGALTYIHAVGTPTVMAMIVLSFFVLMPRDWPFLKRLAATVGLSLLMILVASGFILNYLSIRGQAEVVDYSRIISLYRSFYPPDILNVQVSVRKLLRQFSKLWIIQFAFIGLVLVWILNKKERRNLLVVISWLAGIFIVAIFIPFIERLVESYLRILPIETELIRGIRYFVPTLGLLAIWGMSQLAQRVKLKLVAAGIGILGLFFVYHVFTLRLDGELSFEKTAACLSQEQLFCTEASDLHDLLLALRNETPIGATIFFSDTPRATLPLAVRYYSQRSLVYSWKDRGLGFANPAKMIAWSELYYEMDAHGTINEWYEQDPTGLLNFVNSLGADYLVLNKPLNPLEIRNHHLDLFYENETYIVLKLETP